MKKLILFLTTCLALIWSTDVRATHLMGADLTYTIVGPHQYIVSLSVYRDCNSAIVQPTSYRIFYQSVACSDTGSFVVSVASGYPVNATDTCPSQHSTCNGGTVYGVQQWVYTSPVVSLPAGCSDVVLSWASGNRNAVITNLTNPLNDALYISAEVNTSLIDNSPQFLNPLTVSLCLGQTNYINQGGYDANGDSLVYVLDTAQGNVGMGPNGGYPYSPTALNYTPGYTPTHPITSTTFNFDASTGEITVIPTQTEYDVVKLIVYEYRNGVLIGHVERDMQIEVNICTDTLPTVSGIGGLGSTDSVYTIFPCTSGCFTVYSSSADTSKTLTLTITGQSAFPGATFTTTAGKDPSLTFCWSPTRANAGIFNFTVTVKDDNCPSPGRNTQNYKIIVPEIYPAGADTTICQYNVAATHGTDTAAGSWAAMSTNPITTNIISPTLPITVITGFSLPGRYNYIWTRTSGGCGDTMSVYVTSKPYAGPDQNVCEFGVATMAGTGTGRWHALATNPSVTTITDTTSSTTTVTGFTSLGIYTYVWTSNGCSDTVNITSVVKPNAGPDQFICGGTGTVTMAGSGVGIWTAAAGNPGAAVITAPASPTTTITGLTISGVYTFYYGNGCEDTVQISINTQPHGGPDQTICQDNTVIMGATGIGTWSAFASNPATTVFDNANADSTVVTGFTITGTYYFTWAVGTGCFDTVAIMVTGRPDAGPDQSICQYSTATMAATGTGAWVAIPTNPSSSVIVNPTSPTTQITGFILPGTYKYIWSANGCVDTAYVLVKIKPNAGPDETICQYITIPLNAVLGSFIGTSVWTDATGNPAVISFANDLLPNTFASGFTAPGVYTLIWTESGCSDSVQITVTAKPNAGPDQTVCQYTTATMAASGTGTWTDGGANPTTTVIVNPSSPTTLITGFTVSGTYSYIWSVNGCPDTAKVFVITKPNAGPDQSVCQYTSTTLGAVGTGTWSASAGNPATVTFANPAFDSTSVSGFTASGVYTLIWNAGGCTDTILITVIAKPNAGPDQTICQYTTATMAASGTGTWTSLSTNPATTVIVTPSSHNTLITGFTIAGTYGYVWTSNGCTDTVDVIVTAKPNAGPDESTCQFSTVIMAATGIGTWSALSTNPATTTIVTPSSPTTTITGFTVAGTYSYVWTSNGCTDTANVIVTPKPNAGPDQTICQYNSTNMAATGNGTWTVPGGNPAVITVASNTSPTTLVSGFTAPGAYTLIWTVNGCSDSVVVNVTAKPNAGPDQTTCQFSTVTMAATGTGTWIALATNPSPTVIVTPTSPTTVISGFTVAGTYSFIWISNGCTDTVNVIVTPKPNAGPDQTICQFSTATMAATGTGTWSIIGTNPAPTIIVTPGSATTTITGFTIVGTYSYVWTSNGCTDTVNVIVTGKPNAGPDQTTCQFSTINMAATGTGTWTALSTNPANTVIVTPTSPTTLIRGFTIAGTYSYIWTTTGGCSDTANVIVTPKPNAGIDQIFCLPGSTTLDATGGPGVWTALATNPGSSNIVSPSSDTTAVNGITLSGFYSYIWTVSGCTDTMVVTVVPYNPAGPDQTICQYNTVTTGAFGTGTWTALSNNPNPTVIANPTADTTTITGFNVPGIYGFIWAINPCPDTMFVSVTAKPDAGPDQTICQYTSTIMGATGTGTWTINPGNPALITLTNNTDPATGASGFTAAGTYTFYWSANGCTDTVLINVTAKPNAGTDQTICQYSSTNMTATGTGTWTADAGNPATVTFANPASPTTSVSGFTISGTYTLYWSLNGCSDTVLVNVTPKPDAGPDQTICQYTYTIMSATGTGTWTASGTNPVVVTITNNTDPNTTITGFTSSGTYTFYWSDNGCSDTVLINVTAKPNAGPDQTICQYSSTNMAATGTGTWTADAGNPATVTFANPVSPTTSVSGFTVAGTYTLYWSLNGCSDTVLVNVTPKPDAGPDQTICQFNSIVMAATGTGTWTASSSNPAITTITNNTDPNTTVTGFTASGTYTFYWSDNGCSDTVLINVTAKPNAGPDQTICQYNTTNMAATGAGTWTADAGNPTVVTITNATDPTTSISGFNTPGTYTFYWSLNGCSDTVLIIVTAKPDAGPDQSLCLPGMITTAASAGAGLWTALSSNPATTIIVTPNSNITVISGFTTGGTYSYVWTVNGCSDTMSVYIVPLSPAGPDQTTCQYSTITTAAFGTGIWTASTGNPSTTTFSDSSSATTTISGFDLPGVYNFIWNVNGCIDTMSVTVIAKPDAGPDQTICQYTSTNMAATGTGTWTADAGNPVVVTFANTSDPGTLVSGFTASGTYTLYWSLNGCSDTVLINVTAKPNAGPDQTICQYSSTNMAATGTGTWTADAGNPAIVTIANSTDPNTLISGFNTAGTYTFYWSLNGCTDTVLINVTAKPDAGPDQTICQYSSTNMAASGTGTWSADAGNPALVTFANANDPATTVSGFNAPGTYSLYWSLNGCSDTVLITVTAKPNAGPDQTICQYSSTSMGATGTGTWTADAGNPIAVTITNATDPNTSITGFNTAGTYTFYWSLNGCTDTVLINVTAKPAAGPDQTICQGSSVTMAATGIGIWTADAGNPATVTFANNADPATIVSGFSAPGTYSLYWSLNGCSDTINVIVVQSSTLTVSNGAICLGSNDTLTALVSVPGGTFLWSPGGQTTPSIIVSPGTTSTFTVTYTIAVCGTYTDSATVTVYPTLTLTTQSDTICTGSSATLSTTPSTAGGSYLWSPGGFTTSSITVSPTTNTFYTVTYTLAGCPVTSVADTVDVTIPPTVTINNGTICLGDSVTLTATPSQPGGTYTWSPGGQTTQSITVSPASTTTYTVSYGIPLSVCPPTTQTATVTVTPQPTIAVSNATICDGQSATLTATPTPAGGTYIWSPGGNTTSGITVSPTTTSTYSVIYTIAGCGSASGVGVVTVNPDPIVTGLTVQPITCYGYTNGTLTPIITPASGTYTYEWSNSETGAVDTGLAAGSYTLTITDQNGCTAISTAGGVIGAAPAEGIAEITPGDITVFQDSMIQLTATLSNYTATTYSWMPTTGLSCIDCPNPIVNTTTATDTLVNYTVTITYNNGCSSIAVDTIHILSGIALPDAFTPNGDHINDTFYIPSKGVKDFHLTIYNRWGELVFESYDPYSGWDGTFKNTQQPGGVYEYFVAITYLNGQSLAKTGNVTLLR